MDSPIKSQNHIRLEVPSSSFHRYSSCLPSPADPSTWEGASCRARFGMDIGGTLCKVVYFEPFDSLESPAGVSKNTCFSESKEATKTRISCSSTANISVCGEMMGDDTRQSLFSAPWKHQDAKLNADGQSNSLEHLLARSSLECESNNGKLPSQAEPMDRVKSLNHVRKIWISSHDPVVLPGRGTLYFKCFETWRMEEFLVLSKEHSLVSGERVLGATGGGARKFRNQFLQIAGLQLNHADELTSLVRGIDFLMKHAQHESVEYPKGSFQGGAIQRPLWLAESGDSDNDENFRAEEHDGGCLDAEEVCTTANVSDGWDKPEKQMARGVKKLGLSVAPRGPNSGRCIEGIRNLYPYLVVNIGSGVSILLVESPEHFQRVGGTSLGGSTFFGLASVLTGCESFEEAINLAAGGDSTEIDMLVGDIYGGDYSEMGLAATTVASSFGKLVHPARRAMALNTPQHLAKATLLMITNNIGSLAKLHAQATGVEHVLFTGSFMHGNKLAMRLLTVAMEFWSKGQIKAIFLRHEGHAGAMGALLSTLDLINPTDASLLS